MMGRTCWGHNTSAVARHTPLLMVDRQDMAMPACWVDVERRQAEGSRDYKANNSDNGMDLLHSRPSDAFVNCNRKPTRADAVVVGTLPAVVVVVAVGCSYAVDCNRDSLQSRSKKPHWVSSLDRRCQATRKPHNSDVAAAAAVAADVEDDNTHIHPSSVQIAKRSSC